MFIIIRIIVSAVAFFIRFTGIFSAKPVLNRNQAGRSYGVKINRHKGRFVSMELSSPLETSFLFKLTRESSVDQLAKRLGISHEMHSGEAGFDEAVYVASDHPALHQALKSRQKFRDAVSKLLEFGGYSSVQGDGKFLKLVTKSYEAPSEEDLALMFLLVDELKAADQVVLQRRFDPFVIRALLVEAAVWSLAAYAITSGLEFAFSSNISSFVRSYDLLVPGILLTVAVLGLLFGFIVMFLRGSSRSHRVIVESFILLLISLPICGFQAAKDINEGLDISTPIEARLEVTRKWQEKLRGRRGSVYYVYHLYFRPLNAAARHLGVETTKVSYSTFNGVTEGQEVLMLIGPGWLHIPWIRELRFPES